MLRVGDNNFGSLVGSEGLRGSSSGVGPEGLRGSSSGAVELVIDEDRLMIAMQLALKEWIC